MIFVTVGAQMPFDRLIRAVDAWAGRCGREDIFAQVGQTTFRPAALECVPFIDPAEYRQRLFEADAVITHAGMGTILTALELGTPILAMPRRADLGETRNDHQFGTAEAFRKAGRIGVAWNEQELAVSLSRLETLPEPKRVASHASFQLLHALRQFIRHDGKLTVRESRDTQSPHPHPALLRQSAPPRDRRRAA